ncbi:MAG: Phenol hydroxylase, assembly protein DmpK [Burkholderiaceae bacterium]|jgi:phenol hydroxylase P0 protein|nr:MAG: Phenol hydroxylase, assembly protein DmpK [Burkholderiaceae bacterium]
MNLIDPSLELPACDPSRKYVRRLAPREDGLVAFEFSIGWPELAVELLLPGPAFAEFCTANRVQHLDALSPHQDLEETRE